MTDETEREDTGPPAGPLRRTWLRVLGSGLLLTVGTLAVQGLAGRAQPLAAAASLWMGTTTFLHAFRVLTPHLLARDTAARVVYPESAVMASAASPLGPRGRAPARRFVLCVCFLALGTSVAVAVWILTRGSPWLALAESTGFVCARLVLPGRELRAGVESPATPSDRLLSLAGSLRIPTYVYLPYTADQLAPILFVGPFLSLAVMLAGPAVPVSAGVRASAERIVTAIDRIAPPAPDPEEKGRGGATPSATPTRAANRPRPTPTPSHLHTAGDGKGSTGDDKGGGGDGKGGERQPPPCAGAAAVRAALAAPPTPVHVAAAMFTVWERLNWPAVGCVVRPPEPIGRLYEAVVQAGESGSGLLVYVADHAVVVPGEFAVLVSEKAGSLVDLSANLSFVAGTYQLMAFDGGRCSILEKQPHTVVVVPPAVSVLALRVAKPANAFPLVNVSRVGDRETVYRVRFLEPWTERPGYAGFHHFFVRYDRLAKRAESRNGNAGDTEACSSPLLQLEKSASLIRQSAEHLHRGS